MEYLPIPNSEWLLLQTIPSTFIISHWMIEMHTFEKEKNWISVKSMHLFFLYLLLRIFEEIIILKNIMEKWNCIYIMRLCKTMQKKKKKQTIFLLKKIFFGKNCTFELWFVFWTSVLFRQNNESWYFFTTLSWRCQKIVVLFTIARIFTNLTRKVLTIMQKTFK